jgi:hypothetical protein
MKYDERRLDYEFQRVAVLLGERGDTAKHAVTKGDMFPVGSRTLLVPTMTATVAAGATPTKAEFDKLVADVQALSAAFKALSTRTGP